jgi:hypothetical protein
MGTMTNEIPPPVSSVTQHCFASDKKEMSLAFAATKCKLMNKKNLMLPFAPTSCASFSSQETPSYYINNNSALFLCQNTFSLAESKSFGSNSESISKNTSFSSNHGSNSISSLSSTTATPLRTVPFTKIPFEKKNIQQNAERFQYTQYVCVLIPTLVVRTDPNDMIKKLMEAMLENRKFLKKQAKRGFAKEASVYFPYLDSVLFCTVHYATLPFRHSTNPPFRHSAIPPFRHSAITPFCHSANPPFCHSAIPPFRHSAPILNNAMYVSQEVLRKAVTLPEGLRSNRYVPPLQAKYVEWQNGRMAEWQNGEMVEWYITIYLIYPAIFIIHTNNTDKTDGF